MAHHQSIVRERLDSKLPIHCFKSNFPTIVAPQLLGEVGADCLWFDQEHIPTDSMTMYSLIVASHAVSADAVVRVPNGALADAGRMLDAGADAIMYPRVRSADEVVEFVRYLRFAPLGERGVDTMVFSNHFGAKNADDFTAHSNEQNVLIVQIETAEALEQVDRIARVSGIDLLFIGIGDLTRELRVDCNAAQPRLQDAVARVADAAERHGLAWGMPALSFEHAEELLEAGALFIAHGSDTSLLKAAAKKLCQQMDSLGIPRGHDVSFPSV